MYSKVHKLPNVYNQCQMQSNCLLSNLHKIIKQTNVLMPSHHTFMHKILNNHLGVANEKRVVTAFI